MQRRQVGKVVRDEQGKAVAARTERAPSRPVPLDLESLKRVVGGTEAVPAPHKGW